MIAGNNPSPLLIFKRVQYDLTYSKDGKEISFIESNFTMKQEKNKVLEVTLTPWYIYKLKNGAVEIVKCFETPGHASCAPIDRFILSNGPEILVCSSTNKDAFSKYSKAEINYSDCPKSVIDPLRSYLPAEFFDTTTTSTSSSQDESTTKDSLSIVSSIKLF